MTLKDVLTMLFERGNAMQTFWGFYITVAGVLVAFFGGAQRSRLVAGLASFAFVAFAYVNAEGMFRIAGQRCALFNAVNSAHSTPSSPDEWAAANFSATDKKLLLAASTPPNPYVVIVFHAISDFAVLLAIWMLTVRPREQLLTPNRVDDRKRTSG